MDNLWRVTDRAISFGPPYADVVVLVSKVELGDQLRLQIGGLACIPVKTSDCP